MSRRNPLIAGVPVLLLCAQLWCAEGGAERAAALRASLVKALDADAGASKAVKQFVTARLIPLCTNGVLVRQARAQNEYRTSLEAVKRIDKDWITAEEELSIQQEKLSNQCAVELKRILQERPAIVEAFAMDDQGAIVGATRLTSDYWQGDEAKWQNAFNRARGGIDIGTVRFEKATGRKRQCVSLALFTKRGRVVGTVSYDIAVDKL